MPSISVLGANAPGGAHDHDCAPMSTEIIVSYDGTPNDDDALALGRALAAGGARLALAYVRHAHEFDAERERVAQHDAERRLAQGAQLLGDPGVAQHVIFSASTGQGLAELAASEEASVVVFGSDYRIAPGHVEPGPSAQHLLEGGPVAVAVALAGLRAEPAVSIDRVGWLGEAGADAKQTAGALATKFAAALVEPGMAEVDLLVVGSQPGSIAGRIALGGAVRTRLDSARSSVLVLPAGKPITL